MSEPEERMTYRRPAMTPPCPMCSTPGCKHWERRGVSAEPIQRDPFRYGTAPTDGSDDPEAEAAIDKAGEDFRKWRATWIPGATA